MAAFSDPLGLIPLYGICILGDGLHRRRGAVLVLPGERVDDYTVDL